MFSLVSARYERASLIVTSNKPFSAWGEIFGDEMTAVAMIDRLVHHAEILSLKGDSYRLRGKDLGARPPNQPRSADQTPATTLPRPAARLPAPRFGPSTPKSSPIAPTPARKLRRQQPTGAAARLSAPPAPARSASPTARLRGQTPHHRRVRFQPEQMGAFSTGLDSER
jgi:hypothetical protein